MTELEFFFPRTSGKTAYDCVFFGGSLVEHVSSETLSHQWSLGPSPYPPNIEVDVFVV